LREKRMRDLPKLSCRRRIRRLLVGWSSPISHKMLVSGLSRF
jgi:hypothetical protein